MLNLLLVGLGGFVGSALRYGLSGWIHRGGNNSWFPFGTLAVNVAGCLLIGVCSGLTQTRQLFTPEARLFLFIGFLGGFTTFSSFAYETFALTQDGQTLAAMINIFLQIVLGLFAVWLGNLLIRVM